MPDLKVLALIMAGGAGSRLEVLTERRAKPAMPFGGVYRLIDFPLSNCMHSHIRDVWIVQQYQPHSLNDHVSNGRPWDLDRNHGGLRILFPHTGEAGGWHDGNADAIYHNATFIREMQPDVLVVLSADHIYKLDYREVVDAHLDNRAHVTMVTKKVPLDEAGRFGVVELGDDSRITDFQHKPEQPASDVVTTEVFVFDTRAVLDLVDELAGRSRSERDDDEVELEDLGDEVLPRMVKDGNAREYRLEGYWRDVGTIDSYWASHMDLLDHPDDLDLSDPSWPIHTFETQLVPARIFQSARIDNSLISPHGVVRGRVEHSVIGPGVAIEEGAVVRDSVILQDCVIEAGATVDSSILDMGVTIGKDATVGNQMPAAGRPRPSDIAVVGQRATVRASGEVGPGERIEPASDG
jgi:glucose-1-phosphate adenylyltransferase